MPLAVGQELTLDFELKPAGVQEAVTVVGDRAGARHELRAHRRQRERARSRQPAGQRPADVAADAAGARLAERRHRHVAGHPLLAAAPSSRTPSGTTASKARRSSTRRPGNLNGENRDAVQAAGEPRERAGVPRRIERLPRRVRHRHRRPGERRHQVGRQRLPRLGCSSTCAATRSTRPTTSITRRADLPKSLLEAEQFGGSIGGPIVKDRAFFFGSYEGYRLDAGINIVEAVPSAAAWARAVPAIAALRPGFLAPGAVILPGKSTNPDFDIAQLQAPQTRDRERLQRPRRLQAQRQVVVVRPRVPRPGHERPARRRQRAASSTSRTTRATRCSTCRVVLSDSTINEFKFGYNAAPTNIIGQAPRATASTSRTSSST